MIYIYLYIVFFVRDINDDESIPLLTKPREIEKEGET